MEPTPPPGPMDSVVTLVDGQVTDLTTFLTGTAGPAVFGLAILGIGIALGLKYVRRGASKA